MVAGSGTAVISLPILVVTALSKEAMSAAVTKNPPPGVTILSWYQVSRLASLPRIGRPLTLMPAEKSGGSSSCSISTNRIIL